MQSLKSPYILYNQQSVGSTLHNNLLFIIESINLIHLTLYVILYKIRAQRQK